MPYKFNIFTGTFDMVSAAVAAVLSHLLMEDTTDLLMEDGTLLLTEA